MIALGNAATAGEDLLGHTAQLLQADAHGRRRAGVANDREDARKVGDRSTAPEDFDGCRRAISEPVVSSARYEICTRLTTICTNPLRRRIYAESVTVAAPQKPMRRAMRPPNVPLVSRSVRCPAW